MIYVSSACVRHDHISGAVQILAQHGFKNIELSGGTKYYNGFEDDLVDLKEKHGLNFLLHNYFPPPERDFVLNLASLQDSVYNATLQHIERSLDLSRRLGSQKFGFHAGYFIDIKTSEVGGKVSFARLFDRTKATTRFRDGFAQLLEKASGLELYLENNVLSHSNAQTYQPENPFMLTDYQSYLELKKLVDFKLLLDLAHLKVSANSLDLAFEDELDHLIRESDYLHLSENDGLYDQNRCLFEDSQILQKLKEYELQGKTITLELYEPVEQVKKSYEVIQTELWLTEELN